MSSAETETAKGQWAHAHRRLQETRTDRARHERLHRQVDAVAAELRRRIGETFTLDELVAEYARAERWSRDAAASVSPGDEPDTVPDLALVEDAAFHLYARGAVDYEP